MKNLSESSFLNPAARKSRGFSVQPTGVSVRRVSGVSRITSEMVATRLCFFLALCTVAVRSDTAGNSTTEDVGSSSATYGVFGGGSRVVYGYNAFVPAPPGKRPSCAGPSDTYCEKIEQYPSDLIDYLLRRYGYDFNTLIMDETTDTVELGQSLATPYSVGPILVPDEGIATNVSLPTGNDTPDYLPPAPYYGPYLYPRAYWWLRYIRTSDKQFKDKPFTLSSKRVIRQAATTATDEQLCPTVSQFIVPRAAMNAKGNWMFVVNQEPNSSVTQLVRTDRCTTMKCSGLCQLPAGFESKCQQQFVQKRLVALNANGQNLYTDTFWFPHCCICRITSRSSDTGNGN